MGFEATPVPHVVAVDGFDGDLGRRSGRPVTPSTPVVRGAGVIGRVSPRAPPEVALLALVLVDQADRFEGALRGDIAGVGFTGDPDDTKPFDQILDHRARRLLGISAAPVRAGERKTNRGLLTRLITAYGDLTDVRAVEVDGEFRPARRLKVVEGILGGKPSGALGCVRQFPVLKFRDLGIVAVGALSLDVRAAHEADREAVGVQEIAHRATIPSARPTPQRNEEVSAEASQGLPSRAGQRVQRPEFRSWAST